MYSERKRHNADEDENDQQPKHWRILESPDSNERRNGIESEPNSIGSNAAICREELAWKLKTIINLRHAVQRRDIQQRELRWKVPVSSMSVHQEESRSLSA